MAGGWLVRSRINAAGRGVARQGKARQGLLNLVLSRPVGAGHGKAQQGKSRFF